MCDVSQICSINCFPWSTSGWHGWLTGRCPRRAFASCLKCGCQCTAVWAFVEGACGNMCVFIYLHGHDRVWREKLRMSVEVGLCDHHWSKNNKREGSCYICFCVSMHAWYEENTRCKKPFVVTCSKVWWCFVCFQLKRRCASMFFITDVANFHPLVILGLPDHLSKNIWGNNCQHLPDGCR